eukprot:TRINITY_DN29145_c0_g1_i1.p1 TRINITY_DN29145_c0_g1~~TRINITY_DN29145_c0_g1_i1.p1  ORF type:complete len:492 (-),score=236.39 TRINITY_DN29145_c0_g1_i1:27-1409(-)
MGMLNRIDLFPQYSRARGSNTKVGGALTLLLPLILAGYLVWLILDNEAASDVTTTTLQSTSQAEPQHFRMAVVQDTADDPTKQGSVLSARRVVHLKRFDVISPCIANSPQLPDNVKEVNAQGLAASIATGEGLDVNVPACPTAGELDGIGLLLNIKGINDNGRPIVSNVVEISHSSGASKFSFGLPADLVPGIDVVRLGTTVTTHYSSGTTYKMELAHVAEGCNDCHDVLDTKSIFESLCNCTDSDTTHVCDCGGMTCTHDPEIAKRPNVTIESWCHLILLQGSDTFQTRDVVSGKQSVVTILGTVGGVYGLLFAAFAGAKSLFVWYVRRRRTVSREASVRELRGDVIKLFADKDQRDALIRMLELIDEVRGQVGVGHRGKAKNKLDKRQDKEIEMLKKKIRNVERTDKKQDELLQAIQVKVERSVSEATDQDDKEPSHSRDSKRRDRHDKKNKRHHRHG